MHTRSLGCVLALASAMAACAGDRSDTSDGSGRAWTVHSPGVVDPSSRDWHGRWLRERRWAPMLDGNDENACGRCHDGAPARPTNVAFAAPGATDCRTCHKELDGVLSCKTCHDVSRSNAHAAHVASSPSREAGFACSTCHPVPNRAAGSGVIGGLHGNGAVEIFFDPAIVTREASYERETGACAVSCHNRGGDRARPRWTETKPMRCGDCHASPPARHFPGACSRCHQEADGPLHINGRVDLGDGGGKCGACHGQGADPWPGTAAHAKHKNPVTTTSVDCANCHPVPASTIAQGHLDGVVDLALSGRAVDRGARPRWENGTCSGVACHGANLVDEPTAPPAWVDTSSVTSACVACHGTPPSQHTTSTSCDRSTCHGGEVARMPMGLEITPNGRALHINGVIDAR